MTGRHHAAGNSFWVSMADIMTGHCERRSGAIYFWGRMVRLEGEELNSLFEALEEWEYHLARLDSKRLRCENDEFAP